MTWRVEIGPNSTHLLVEVLNAQSIWRKLTKPAQAAVQAAYPDGVVKAHWRTKRALWKHGFIDYDARADGVLTEAGKAVGGRPEPLHPSWPVRWHVPEATRRIRTPVAGRAGGIGRMNTYEAEMTKALEKHPPEILWRKNNRGILVAVEVRDPYGETTIQAQAERLRASADRAERAEAYEVAEAIRQHRANNTPLMTSARSVL